MAELVTLKTYWQEYEAALDHSLLSDAGIESYIADQNISSMQIGYSIAAGGIRLQVKTEDAERAAGVLGLINNKEPQEIQTVQCPICHSDDTKPLSLLHPLNWKNLFMLFLGALTVSPAKVQQKYGYCHHCKNNFQY